MNCGLRHFGNDVMQNRMTERTSHLAGLWIGATNFKHVSLKQSQFYLCKTSTAHR